MGLVLGSLLPESARVAIEEAIPDRGALESAVDSVVNFESQLARGGRERCCSFPTAEVPRDEVQQ